MFVVDILVSVPFDFFLIEVGIQRVDGSSAVLWKVLWIF